MSFFRQFIRVMCIAVIAAISFVVLFLSFEIALYYYYKEKLPDEDIQKIYAKLLAVTGQSQDDMPLRIVNRNEINAYTDGNEVVLYKGIIRYAKNEDEIAMILGHEIAHKMLRHTHYDEFRHDSLEISVGEANADKLGAVYMIKAGYDICKARQLWKRMQIEHGDYQGYDHPTYGYRYDQLNINCE